MKCIYEASSGLEGHMILNLLQQQGIDGRIDGEYLQGGAGELQAMNMVRVLVDESDYSRARSVIDHWDSMQVEKAQSEKVQVKPKSSGIGIGLVMGLVAGAGLTYWAYNTPVTTSGIDYDGDGVLDEKWVYADIYMTRNELDRNLDGKYDLVYKFSYGGVLDVAESDENFDGVFETKTKFIHGNAVWSLSDTTGNGLDDLRVDYKNGIVEKITFIHPYTRKPVKVQNFSFLKLVSAEADLDGDGFLETIHEYDDIEEVSNTYVRYRTEK